MSRDNRPDPDILLKSLREQEDQSKRGHLRVFLGMSAGVGKTYSMLRAAQGRMREGCDVLIAVVETHGRKETMALVENLPILPKKKSEYKGVILEEMDLDAILVRRPQLVLVDELAHTNVPGSRHEKRYQDVIEILESGIDVYTTINVQHLESRKDVVEKITGVLIRETVPDSILELASQIEVVDITPGELLKRLKEGKVYLGDKAERAAQNFFKQDSLTALREIALRFTAEKVDQELQRYLEIKPAGGPWQTNERLMVAVSHSPYSERLIRATRRLAYNLEAPWIAVHIDSGIRLSDTDQSQLAKNLNLARELRAEVVTTADMDIPNALRRIAKQKNVTQIVVGRPTKRWIRDTIFGGSLLDRLVRESWEIDVHVIRQDDVPIYRTPLWVKFDFDSGFLPYWNTFCFLAGTALLSGFVESLIGYRAVGFIFLLSVLTVGMLSRLGPVIFSAVLSVLVWNFFFIPPRLTFHISEPEDFILSITYLLVAVIIGTLTARVRKHQLLIRENEERTNVLYEVLRDISSTRDKTEFLTKVVERVSQVLEGECSILLKDKEGNLVRSQKRYYAVHVDDKEMAVAQWAFGKKKAAGWSTDTLSHSKGLYIPLEGDIEVVGVFVYFPTGPRKLSLEQENLLFSICSQLGRSLERHFIDNRLRENEKLQESEKLHQTLLSSISHEMRTPLTAIMGSASALEDENTPDTREFRKVIASELSAAGDRLNRVIENLLDMSRLNSGAMAIRREWHDIHDLVGVSLQRLGRNLEKHQVRTEMPDELPLIEMDFRLMEHAFSNLLINAVMYTPPGTEIRVSSKVHDGKLLLIVEDSGPGIPEESIPRLFDKFYRVPGSTPGGTGLGLSIVKSIVEFHKGEITAENRDKGGARFVIALPLGSPPEGPVEPVT